MNRKQKTAEELRKYDIFKGIVAALIAILLLISIVTGRVDPDDIALLGSGADTAVEATAEAPAELEISAPELSEPAPGSELMAGPVPFSGTGSKGSQVAIVAGSQELGRTPVADNGAWEFVVEMSPEIDEVDLQALDSDGNVAATSAGIPFTVIDSDAAADEAAADIFTADPLPETSGAGMITISGAGQAGYEVAIDFDGEQAAVTEINEEGTWSVDVDSGEEGAEVSANLISADGEVIETVSVGQIEAAEVILPEIEAPESQLTAGDVVLSGSGQPGTTLQLYANGVDIGTVVVDDDGVWSLETTLPTDDYEIEVVALDEEGNGTETVTTVTLSVAAADAPEVAGWQLPIPEFSALSGALAWAGTTDPDTSVTILVDGEEIDVVSADADGKWQININLEAGAHDVAFGRMDEDGNVTAQTEPVTVEIPGQLPQINLPEFSLPDELLALAGEDAQTGDDAEGEAADRDSLLARIDLEGIKLPGLLLPAGLMAWDGSAEPGSEVAVLVDGEIVDTTTAGADGSFSLSSELSDGEHTLQLGVVGEDGELSGRSREISISATGQELPTLEVSGDEYSLVISGTAEPGSTVEITADGETIGEAPADENGNWSFETDPLPEGTNLRARVLGEDGHPMLRSIPLALFGPGAAAAAGGEEETAAEGGAEAHVTGAVSYKERIALPDDAVVTVQIQDISTPSSSATVIGEQIIETNGQQAPIPFDVTYDPADIVDDHTYSVAARIEDGSGNLLFVNDTANPVITNDNPTEDVQVETIKVDTSVSDVVLDESEDVIGEDGESAVEAAEGSDSFSKLLEGLQAAGLTQTLEDVEGEYTLFAPTDEAFQSIPPELVEAWDANPEAYEDLLRLLVVEGKYPLDELTDGQVLTSLAGKEIEITRDGDIVYANGVPIIDSAEVGNSVVHAMPQIFLQVFTDGGSLPVIDESGVPTFVGPLLTVVGLAEPGTEILLTVDDEPFGEIATVEPNGFWLVKQNIDSGVHYILAYMRDDQGLLKGISQEVVLPVP
jgi:uncharacterized lipoprotein YbaY